MITFDDGYRDNHDVVLPILKRHQAKAVFFIATSYVADRRIYWWEHINHAIADQHQDRLSLLYPQRAGRCRWAMSRDRLAAVKTLLKMVKARAGRGHRSVPAGRCTRRGGALRPRTRSAGWPTTS